ncbi:hypothetical protein GCM10007094_25800 [Pseudovibrio japonicus]|uniref:Lipoprotein n=1 Tax=Pseudovibrio japonicus TaxID=366534 RepID=A0ABQ3EE86_9HYPH|nr:hypothetical protein GCM10007094_25800 [Pseudovibrio japonicus]
MAGEGQTILLHGCNKQNLLVAEEEISENTMTYSADLSDLENMTKLATAITKDIKDSMDSSTMPVSSNSQIR